MSQSQIVVEGEYVVSTAEGKKLRKYRETLNVLDIATGLSDVLKYGILESRLKSKDPDFRRIRTHSLVDIVSDKKTMDLNLMGWDQLEREASAMQLPVKRADFDDISQYREAIALAQSTPDRYTAWIENYRQDRKRRRMLESLNDIQRVSSPIGDSAKPTSLDDL